MIRVEDNRSLRAMANREDLHVAFTRHRVEARMFVQSVDVLREVAGRSIIDPMSARDLERYEGLRRMNAFVERLREQANRFARTAKSAVARERERIRELLMLKKQSRSMAREQSPRMST
jgi:hypothetical protein